MSSSAVHAQPNILHEKLPCIFWPTLAWTVWAFESRTFAQLGKRLLGNDVTARHHHRWVFVGCLLFRDRADENGVEVVGRRQGYLNLGEASALLCT